MGFVVWRLKGPRGERGIAIQCGDTTETIFPDVKFESVQQYETLLRVASRDRLWDSEDDVEVDE